jgi:hypothetical protein
MRECRGRRWGLTHAPLRAGPVTAPRRHTPAHHRRRRGTCASRVSQPPPPATLRVPSPYRTRKPIPNPYPMAGRRGRKEGARLTLLPIVDHHERRARSCADPPQPNQTKPIALRINKPLPLPVPSPSSRSRCLAPAFLSTRSLSSSARRVSCPRQCRARAAEGCVLSVSVGDHQGQRKKRGGVGAERAHALPSAPGESHSRIKLEI